ncbi:MAG: hypothetical protein M3Q81_01455 [bacterium]|nr:hypothetical protein [bacterium]
MNRDSDLLLKMLSILGHMFEVEESREMLSPQIRKSLLEFLLEGKPDMAKVTLDDRKLLTEVSIALGEQANWIRAGGQLTLKMVIRLDAIVQAHYSLIHEG